MDESPAAPSFGGLSPRRIEGFVPTSKYDLTLYIRNSAAGIHLRLAHDPSRFSKRRVAGILAQFAALLRQAVAKPDLVVDGFSLVGDADAGVLPDPTIPIVAAPMPTARERFEEMAARFPGATALEDAGRAMSYRALAETVDSLAKVYVASGIKPGAVVAVSGARSFGLVAAMLAVWKARAVLLTLDPLVPGERQRVMLQQGRATHRVEIGRAPGTTVLPSGVHRVRVDHDGRASPCSPRPTGPTDFVAPDGAAYVFFTSGTTGTPKAILGTHAGLAHFLEWQRATFRVGPGDRVAQLTGLSFDVVLRDVFLPLTTGATLCLPRSIDDPADESVPDWLEREKITLLHSVPSLLGTWLEDASPGVRLASMRCLFVAGEPLADGLARRWRAAFPECGRIVNLYGPTETTLAKCAFEVPDPPIPGVQPIGFPIPGSQALVLNRAGHPCGIGETGEIVIRTPYGSLGYLDMPAESGRAFRPNPFRDDPDDLVYFTGDRGRFRPDGSLDIVGRGDDQVKILGVRIEPSEVNAAIAAQPGVRASAVLAAREPGGNARLVAFIVPDASADRGLEATVRGQLTRTLPMAMIPGQWVTLDRMPLLPNGKVDRAALLRLAASATRREKGPPATTPEEHAVATIWNELLPRVPDDVSADFFGIGGHSLLAIRMLSRIRETTGCDIPLRMLFEDPTIGGLARALRGSGPGSAAGIPDGLESVCALRATGSRPPLFVFPGGNGGDRELYVHASLAEFHLGSDHPVYGLRRRGWDGKNPPHRDIHSMTRDYLAEIRRVQPRGPYFFLGDCTGGNIAFAVACRLQQEGDTVGWLALADCVVPVFAEYQRYWIRSRFRRFRQSLAGRILFNAPRMLAVVHPEGRRWFREKWSRHAGSIAAVQPDKAPGPEYWTREGEQYRRAVTTHRPGIFEGRIDLFLSSGNATHPRLRAWGKHATRGVVANVLPGDHWHYLWEGADRVAAICRDRMDAARPPDDRTTAKD
jgi:amino acid adenylation domain-containing protein